MRVGITGTRQFHPVQHGPIVSRALGTILQENEVVEVTTGGAGGIDAVVGLSLRKALPDAQHNICLPEDRSHTSYWWDDDDDQVRVIACSDYRARNAEIVARSELLVAFPYLQLQRRSGTLMTVNIAKKLDVPVRVFVLP